MTHQKELTAADRKHASANCHTCADPKRRKLASALAADGRTERTIAHAAGIHPTTLSLVKNGRRIPRIETAARLAAALRRTPADLGFPDLASLLKGGAR